MSLLCVKKTITAAQLNALAATSVEILAGVADHYFVPVLAIIEYLAGTVPYPTTGSNLLIETLGGASGPQIDNVLGSFPADGFLTALTSQVVRNAGSGSVDQNGVSAINGKGIWLGTDGDVSGSGNGTLVISLYYLDVEL